MEADAELSIIVIIMGILVIWIIFIPLWYEDNDKKDLD